MSTKRFEPNFMKPDSISHNIRSRRNVASEEGLSYTDSSGNIYKIDQLTQIIIINPDSANNIDRKILDVIESTNASSSQKGGEKSMVDTIDIKLFFDKINGFLKLAPENLKNTFLEDLFKTLSSAYFTNDFSKLTVFIEEWVDTIDIYSSPESIKEYEEAIRELEEGKGIEWVPGMFLE